MWHSTPSTGFRVVLGGELLRRDVDEPELLVVVNLVGERARDEADGASLGASSSALSASGASRFRFLPLCSSIYLERREKAVPLQYHL